LREKWAEFGIQYDTKTGKIFCDDLGIWVPLMLTIDTNTKIGDAATFSILHGNETVKAEDLGPKSKGYLESCGCDSIKGTCQCHCENCYCDSGRYPFDGVKAALIIRTIIVRKCLDWFKRAVIAQIKIYGITQCRIHAAGDFYSIDYTNVWHDIIEATIGFCIFWSYTKWDYAEHAFDDLPNMSLVPSITPNGVNFGTCDYLLALREKLLNAGHHVHICACGTEYEKHCDECKVGCKKKDGFTLFILHSTRAYKAGKNDAESFEAVKEIIRNQTN
jgi:hypothetical protein